MTAPATTRNDGRIFSIIGFVMAVPALILFPPVFGLLGVAFGVIGHVKGDPIGKWAVVAAVVCAAVGMALGAYVASEAA